MTTQKLRVTELRDKNLVRSDDALEGVTIRPYAERDLAACERLAGSSTDWPHVVDLNADVFVVAEYADRIVGLAFIQIWKWNRIAWIGDLIVDKQFARRGLGSALLEHIEEEARSSGCRAVMDHPSPDHAVTRFYLQRGYRICGYNDAFFDDVERSTAIFLTKSLRT